VPQGTGSGHHRRPSAHEAAARCRRCEVVCDDCAFQPDAGRSAGRSGRCFITAAVHRDQLMAAAAGEVKAWSK
jgi:hypothetical protein